MNKDFEPINFCDGANALKDFGVRPGEMLSVRLTALCSERCNFCIAKEDMKIAYNMNIDAVVKKVLELKPKALNTIGGEPLLFLENAIKLNKAVEGLVESNYYTTALPRTISTQKELFHKFMESEIVHLIISVQSTDWKKNNELMNSRRKSFNKIELLAEILEDYADRCQIHLNLVKGGIDNREALFDALDHLQTIGAKKVRINELQKAPEQYVNFEEITGLEMNSPFASGCKTKLVDFFPGLEITVKRSCFLVENSLGATVEDEAKVNYRFAHPEKFTWAETGVIYEDGHDSFYWKKVRKD